MSGLAWALVLQLAAAPAGAVKIERLLGTAAQGPAVEVVSGQALVRFSSGTARARRTAMLAPAGAGVSAEFPKTGWTVVTLPAGVTVSEGLRSLRGLPGVLAVEPNHFYRPTRVPNDPFVSSQYALSQVNAFTAWEYEVGTSCRVTVAMIDSGILGTQPDLAGKIVSSGAVRSQFFDPDLAGAQSVDDPPTPACNHATHTSAVAAAATDNGLGIAGMSWGAQLLSLKVFNDVDCNTDCSGTGANPDGCGTTDDAVINALAYAVSIQNTPAAGKVVVNMSLGGGGSCPGTCPLPAEDCHQALLSGMQAAVAAGIPLTVSTGNGGGAVEVPANCAGTTGGSGIIPVGATDSGNGVTYFSSRGPELAANGVVAPGFQVKTDDLGGGTVGVSGTSFSAPYTAGLAALILSAKGSLVCDSAVCPQYVQSVIQGGADDIGVSSALMGAGRIDAFRSLRLAVNGTLADFEGDQKAIAFPNPFRPSRDGRATITVPASLQGGAATIKIYTAAGELLRELKGLTWDGKNAAGAFVASGTYVFVVSTGKGTTRGRVAVIR